MAYNPTVDFLALIRTAGGAASIEKMPGLDYVMAAMARAGLFQLYVGQVAPMANQATTAWLKPSVPSWTAEGTVFLWNANTAQYELATPSLWAALLNPVGGSVFQSLAVAAGVVANATTLYAIRRAGPVATVLTLPAVASRAGKALRLVDWSTGVVNHTITLTPAGGQTIMQQALWGLLSTPDQLAGINLYPSIDLNGWAIAP